MADDSYYVRARGKVTGPYTISSLQKKVKRGMLGRVDHVSPDMASWNPAGDYEDLFPRPLRIAQPTEPVPQVATQPVASPYAVPASFPQPPPSDDLENLASALPANRRDAPPAYRPAVAGASYKGFAITAMVLALVGLFCFGMITGVLAVIFAAIALSGMGRTRNDEGKGMAVAGLVIGIVDVAFWLIWWSFWMSLLSNIVPR